MVKREGQCPQAGLGGYGVVRTADGEGATAGLRMCGGNDGAVE